MVTTNLTPTSNLDPTDPSAFLEAQQAHDDAYNALFEAERQYGDVKVMIAATKRAMDLREAELFARAAGGNKEARDASLTVLKHDDPEYKRLLADLVVQEDSAADLAAEVNLHTAATTNAKLRMQFLIAWNQAEAQRREAL